MALSKSASEKTFGGLGAGMGQDQASVEKGIGG